MHYVELLLRQIKTKHLIHAMSALKRAAPKGEADLNYDNLGRSFLTQAERDMINKRMRLQYTPSESTAREKQMQGKQNDARNCGTNLFRLIISLWLLATYNEEEIEEIVEQEQKNPNYELMLRLTQKRIDFEKGTSLEQPPELA